MAHKFVNLGKKGKKICLYKYNKRTQKLVKARQVLWGDWLSIDEHHDFSSLNIAPGYLAVKWAPKSANAQTLYIKEEETADKRPLEMIFLDRRWGCFNNS